MSASFSNAKKTFSAVVNGVTKLVAALFNTGYDEIEAIETMLGAMGSTLANTDSYRNLLISYKRGCDLAYKSAGDIYVRAGEIAIPDASGNLRFRRNTSDLTVDWDDIDTGSEAASTTYYVYAIADAAGSTFTVKISTSSSAPSGATFYRKLGSFYNDSSSNINQRDIIANIDISSKFGDWVDKSSSYGAQQATTDGEVHAYAFLANGNYLRILTDAANPPTIVRQEGYTDSGIQFTASLKCSVKKGDYWMVTNNGVASGSVVVYWMPKGA
ncbi:MAG: hypothetical protein WC478_01155 [Candidatus Omnitrophota bacterium]